MELNLIEYTTPQGSIRYYAVNDRHYDGMLAAQLDEHKYGSWRWLGDIIIEEEILNEQGYFWQEDPQNA